MDNKNEMNLESYWQDVKDKNLDKADLKEEFAEGTYQVGMASKNRRDFLKIMGFSLSVLPLATSCKKISAQKAIPYLHKNDQITPGVANWYATTGNLCSGHCSLLVKTREGRPIKVEGNPLSPLTKGGTCPVCQASVLSLYDSSRFKLPKKKGQYSSFTEIDGEIKAALTQSVSTGKRTALVLSAIAGPLVLRAVDKFKAAYGNVDVILYNPMGNSALVEANSLSFGQEDVFWYDLEKANLIIGFSSDFLAIGSAPVQLTKQYSRRKDLSVGLDIIRHVQVEGIMSMTGTNADSRMVASPDEEAIFIHNLLTGLQKKLGTTVLPVTEVRFDRQREVNELLSELLRNQGKSVVLTGSHQVGDQIKVNAINWLLGNFGQTIGLTSREYVRYEKDSEFVNFLQSASKGHYSNIIFYDVNPYYDYCDQAALEKAMIEVHTRISLAPSPDETSEHCDYISPDRHYLEKWNDTEVARGVFSFTQPLIKSLFTNRAAEESLLVWAGESIGAEDQMKNLWRSELLPKYQKGILDSSWNKIIHDGILVGAGPAPAAAQFHYRGGAKLDPGPASDNSITLKLYEKIAIGKGKLANNPWLQEMPDPVTKVTWDNYLLISPKLAREKMISTGDIVSVKAGKNSITVPALVQPGVHERVIGLALGYGRKVCGKAGKDVGVNAYPFMVFQNGNFSSGMKVDGIEKVGKTYELAMTQTHHSMEGRDIVKETTLGKFRVNPSAGNSNKVKLVSMWQDHKKDGHQWAMMIDLNKCTGCSGCVISCNAENNVPVVGKAEVHARREMHWLRLDRYYKGDEANPEVVHQPMMCSHCDNAPCETVCPVLATVQSSDGLNQQVYNRCVGTRYCANNCPYKVRRFNWFDYAHDDKLENMVLNPDIVVRSRGVMEKCTMCIQRIQEGKLQAKKEGRKLLDGEIKLACQQSCPADAIVFGDINDPASAISQKLKDPRYYRVLEELGVAPRVGYLTKVRNKNS